MSHTDFAFVLYTVHFVQNIINQDLTINKFPTLLFY